MAAITSAVISVGTSAYSIASNEKKKKDAKEGIRNFQRQELVNPYENIQVSTLKSEQQTEANNINLATSIDALQRGGTQTVLGGLPRINQSNILLQQQISQDLENQERERKFAIAQGEEQIRAIRENRENRALAGLGNKLQTARQDQFTAINGLVQSGLTLGSELQLRNNSNKSVTNPFDDINTDFNDIGFTPTIKGL